MTEVDGRAYSLPSPVVLPDLMDADVWAEHQRRDEERAKATRRSRRLYWLHQLFPWL